VAENWYYGHTNNLAERLSAHNSGLNVSTKGRGPWRYIFQRQIENLEGAVKFEKRLKLLKNKVYIRKKYAQYFIR
jgi:predicted GIY-YIG superfamily endonuclease